MTPTAKKGIRLSKIERFYKEALEDLNEIHLPYLIGGTYAVMAYTGITRATKDLDVFCKAGDYPALIHALEERGYKWELMDERWIAKIFPKNDTNASTKKKKDFIDIIFGTTTGLCQVDDTWFENAPKAQVAEVDVLLIPPEELIWSKSFRQDRDKFDGADIHHLFLKQGEDIDWKRVMTRMEQYWEILLAHILTFRFVYPADRDIVPQWVLETLLERLHHHKQLPPPENRVCRGRIFSPSQYEHAINEWGYLDNR